MKTTYVIMTGMHRTGTSMLAGALGICGLDIGTYFRPVKGLDNPKGCFENLDFKRINVALIKKAGIGPGSFRFPKKWKVTDCYGNNAKIMYRNEIAVFLEYWDRGHPVGWKDPRACLTLGIWKKYIPDLKVITISRPAIEIAHSLKTRWIKDDDWTIKSGLNATKIYLEHLEYHCNGIPRLDVQYHDFFIDQKMRMLILSNLCNFIGVNPVKGWAHKIEKFIDGKLWRERQAELIK